MKKRNEGPELDKKTEIAIKSKTKPTSAEEEWLIASVAGQMIIAVRQANLVMQFRGQIAVFQHPIWLFRLCWRFIF